MTQAREVAAQPVSLYRGWVSACAIFVAFLLLALAGSLAVAWTLGGGRQLAGAFAGWGLCWGAAFLALLLVMGGRLINQGFAAILLAMGLRMVLPLAAALLLLNKSPYWGETNLIPFLLGNYFVALMAETGLAIQLLNGSTPVSASSSAKAKTSAGSPAVGELANGKLVP